MLGRQDASVGVAQPEQPRSPRVGEDPDVGVVDLSVVMPTQQDEVRQVGRPSVGPVPDVVRIDKVTAGAAREAAAAVPTL